jgi:GT2 family glycosyltransferase
MKIYTVVIVNYNSWAYLEKCLTALSRQTFRDFRIAIVDNNSDHPIPESIRALPLDATLIENTINKGFAGANNKAFGETALSSWYFLINPDAFPEPDCIAKLMQVAARYPEYALLGSRLLIDRNTNRIDGIGDRYHISGLAWRDRDPQKDIFNQKPYEVFSACGAAVMIKSDIIKKYGGFDEDLLCYMEDVDFGFRMRLLGQRYLLVPNSVAYHVGSASNGGKHSDFEV